MAPAPTTTTCASMTCPSFNTTLPTLLLSLAKK
jgi:hypothetical protein